MGMGPYACGAVLRVPLSRWAPVCVQVALVFHAEARVVLLEASRRACRDPLTEKVKAQG